MKLYATLNLWALTAVVANEAARQRDPIWLVLWVAFVGLSVVLHEEMK